MIVSNKFKFIFFKAPKTGSTSVELNIKEQIGDKDIVATSVVADLKYGGKNADGMHSHESPLLLKQKISNEIFKEYFKFAVVRNPWDYIVSRFLWEKKYGPRWTWKVHLDRELILRNILKPWKIVKDIYAGYKLNIKEIEDFKIFVKYIPEAYKNIRFYFDSNGNFILDDYIKFENFNNDYKRICNNIGLEYKKLPYVNKTKGKRISYKDFYDIEAKDIVHKEFQKEIDFFGYNF